MLPWNRHTECCGLGSYLCQHNEPRGKAFGFAGTTIKWVGEPGSVDEKGVDAADESRVIVKVDPQYYRPTEVDLLLGDPTKAKTKLGWKHDISFEQLVKEMVEADIAMVKGTAADMEKLHD